MTNGLDISIGNSNNDAQRQPQQQPQQATTMENHSNTHSPFVYGQGMGISTFGQSVHADAGSESFNKASEIINTIVVKSKIDNAIDVIPFPKEVHGNLSYSVIAIARNNKAPLINSNARPGYVTVQVLVVEASGEILRPYQNNQNRAHPFTVTPTTENTFNAPLLSYLSQNLKDKYGTQDIRFIDPVILPRDMNITDEAFLRRLVDASVIAVETRTHVRMPGFQDYNFVKGLGRGDNMILPVTADVLSQDVTDLTGRIFHSDAQVTVSLEQQGNRNGGAPVLNGAQDSRVISRTMVGIDLVPVDPILLEENQVRGRRGRNDFEPEAAWAPRLIARLIDQYVVRTPSGIMFAVAAMAELARDRMWAQSYNQTRGGVKKGANYRDIGYLNIEANLDPDNKERYGRPVDTAAADFKEREMGAFLDATVTRSPILAVDCLTSGVQAYTTTPLYLASRGSATDAARSNAELMHAMNCATNGFLEKMIDMNTPVVIGEGEMVHVGYWFDADDNKRDLFELDNYLAMSVIGGVGSPGLAEEWTDTYLNTREPEDKRMSDRLLLLQSAANGGVVVTGTALRAEINGEVVDKFVQAMAAAKLPLTPRSGEGDLFTTTRNVRREASRAIYRGTGFGSQSVREDRSYGGNRYAANRF